MLKKARTIILILTSLCLAQKDTKKISKKLDKDHVDQEEIFHRFCRAYGKDGDNHSWKKFQENFEKLKE